MSTLITRYAPERLNQTEQFVIIKSRLDELKKAGPTILVGVTTLIDWVMEDQRHNKQFSVNLPSGITASDAVWPVDLRELEDCLRTWSEDKGECLKRNLLIRDDGEIIVLESISKVRGNIIEFPFVVHAYRMNDDFIKSNIIGKKLLFGFLNLINRIVIAGMTSECRRRENALLRLQHHGEFELDRWVAIEGFISVAALEHRAEEVAQKEFEEYLKSLPGQKVILG
jgi:hypothetical protein